MPHVYFFRVAQKPKDLPGTKISIPIDTVFRGFETICFSSIAAPFSHNRVSGYYNVIRQGSRGSTIINLVTGKFLTGLQQDPPPAWLVAYDEKVPGSVFMEARKILAQTFTQLGMIQKIRGELDSALEQALKYYLKSLAIYEEIDYKRGIGIVTATIGLVYQVLDELDHALEYLQQSLSICQKIGDKQGIGRVSGTLGSVYLTRGDLDQAFEHFQKLLTINQEIGFKRGIGINTGNIGCVYAARGDLDKSLDHLQRSLDICHDLGDRAGEAEILLALSETYRQRDELNEALTVNEQARKIYGEINNVPKIGDCWSVRAECEIDSEDLNAAGNSVERALKIYERHKSGEKLWRIPLIRTRLAIAELARGNERTNHEKISQIVAQVLSLFEDSNYHQRFPFRIEAHLLSGLALKLQGELQAAEDTFTQALKIAGEQGYGFLQMFIKKEIEQI